MARVFVTGAAGKVGSALVRRCVDAGDSVVGLTRTSEGSARIAAAGGEPLRGDLADRIALARGLTGAGTVYHLAGGVRGPGAETADRLNREGTAHLVQAVLRETSAPCIVLASSGAIYGDRSGLWVDEDVQPFPNTAYGASKAQAEIVLQRAHQEHGLPTRVARLGVVYGPGFPILLSEARRSGRAWLPGEGRNYLPMIHVEDAVAAVVRIASAGKDGGAYNVADKDPRHFTEFYEALRGRTGEPPVRFWSTWVPSSLQLGVAAENERIQARLGRKPSFTPDNLRLYTASVRLRVDRLEKELGFDWRYPDIDAGVAAVLDALKSAN